MSRVILRKVKITNFGPIKEDEVIFEPFTYFVGRNNAGKSHYLKAIEILLTTKNPSATEIIKLQIDNLIHPPPFLICSRLQKKRAKRKGVWGKEFLPACSALRSGAGGGRAFPQFLRSRKVKQENFRFLN